MAMAAAAMVVLAAASQGARGEAVAAATVGVVSHVKVLSDKVPDVSSMEAWKKAFTKEDMTDEQKMLAAFKSRVALVYQDAPPRELLTGEGCTHDMIKEFNVYGYGMCCCASANIEAMGRYLGLEARGWGIIGHSVPEVKWDGAWHMLDASLINYFPKPDGTIAGVEEIGAAVQGWLEKNPEYKGNDQKLRQFHQAGGWTGWKKGPELLAACPFYDPTGWWPAKTHGWYATMQEYDGRQKTPFIYEYGYSQGYEVNIQLRRGERLTRHWFNKGLHTNGVAGGGDAPGCLKEKIGQGPLAYAVKYGDLTRERIGSALLEYDVPLADGSWRRAALKAENLAAGSEDRQAPAVHVKDAAQPGILEIRMPAPYVYLTGRLTFTAAVGQGGKVRVFFSDNNGLDWRQIAAVEQAGEQAVDLQKLVVRRYDYRLRLVLSGKGTGLDALKIVHDLQLSQRALPTLTRGPNKIAFSAGPQEGTIVVEGASQPEYKGKQVVLADFHPMLAGVEEQFLRVTGQPAEVTFPISTPGDMTRLTFGGHFRARDKADKWDMQVSFDGGKTFKTVDTAAGPTQGACKFVTVGDVPAGTRQALVRWSGAQRNTTCLFSLRIGADYKEPAGGWRPVKITYVWEEGGIEKRDVHVAAKPEETYTITCQAAPEMKSVILELE